jgi:hypothetical protein
MDERELIENISRLASLINAKKQEQKSKLVLPKKMWNYHPLPKIPSHFLNTVAPTEPPSRNLTLIKSSNFVKTKPNQLVKAKVKPTIKPQDNNNIPKFPEPEKNRSFIKKGNTLIRNSPTVLKTRSKKPVLKYSGNSNFGFPYLRNKNFPQGQLLQPTRNSPIIKNRTRIFKKLSLKNAIPRKEKSPITTKLAT